MTGYIFNDTNELGPWSNLTMENDSRFHSHGGLFRIYSCYTVNFVCV